MLVYLLAWILILSWLYFNYYNLYYVVMMQVTFMEYSEAEQLWLVKVEHVEDGADLG